MSSIFGAGKSETRVEGRKLNASERALVDKQLEAAEIQIAAFERLKTTFLGTEGAGDEGGLIGRIDTPELIQQQIRRFQKELEGIEPGVDSDLEALGRESDLAIERGLGDIRTLREDSLRDIRNVLAPRRGLRPTDSPIIDRGQLVAREATRQGANLITGIRGQQAQLERALRERAFENRLRLSSAIGDVGFNTTRLGLGFAAGIPVDTRGTLGAISSAQGRESRISNTAGPFGTTAGGEGYIGPLGEMIGAGVGAAAASSSRSLKRTMGALDTEALMKAVKLLKLDRWKWRSKSSDDSEHIGPYAEDMKEHFGIGNGSFFEVYDMLDMIGLLLGTVQHLDRRLTEAENSEALLISDGK